MDRYTAEKPWKVAKRQHIMRTAYWLFAQKGIGQVTMPNVAEASGVSRATLYRYFSCKLDLVVAIGTWKWEEYIQSYIAHLPAKQLEKMCGAEYLKFFLDSFIDLYREHGDILRFNYDFNSYVKHEGATQEQSRPYMSMVDHLGTLFHDLYERGVADGTLNTEISEESMFSSMFHIMLAAVTRYAVGLVYVSEGVDPEGELLMLEELLLSKFVA